MSDYTLPRAERLRSLKAIRRLFAEGRSGFVYPFRYVVLTDATPGDMDGDTCVADSGEADVEVMFSVPKKFHKRANKRNLLKRRTREAYRLSECREALRESVEGGSLTLNIALIYTTKEVHSYKTISNAVQRILEQVRATV